MQYSPWQTIKKSMLFTQSHVRSQCNFTAFDFQLLLYLFIVERNHLEVLGNPYLIGMDIMDS